MLLCYLLVERLDRFGERSSGFGPDRVFTPLLGVGLLIGRIRSFRRLGGRT